MIFPKDNKRFIHGSIFILSNKLQALGDKITGDLTTKQWFLLLIINNMEQNPPTITDIAQKMQSTRQNIRVMLDTLEKKQYVELSVLSQDKRSQGVYITDKSTTYLKQISNLGQKHLDNIFNTISQQELTCVSRVFNKLFENLKNIDETE